LRRNLVERYLVGTCEDAAAGVQQLDHQDGVGVGAFAQCLPDQSADLLADFVAQ
jgi:hypothetical protein